MGIICFGTVIYHRLNDLRQSREKFNQSMPGKQRLASIHWTFPSLFFEVRDLKRSRPLNINNRDTPTLLFNVRNIEKYQIDVRSQFSSLFTRFR